MTTNPSIKRLTMPKFGTDNPTPDEVEAVRQKAAIYGWTLEQNTAGVVGGKDAHPFGEPTFTLWDQNAKTIMHLESFSKVLLALFAADRARSSLETIFNTGGVEHS